MSFVRLLAAFAAVFVGVGTVHASGLIWSLPEDGAWVRYEGKYVQESLSDVSEDGSETLEWLRHLTIKSVGREEAEYNDQQEMCRWIEIKVITGKPSEAGINPGPVGARIYKVLVPESRIIGDTKDRDEIVVSMLPIVKGYRRIGEGEVQPINAKALRIFPTISLLMHYTELEVVNESDSADIPVGAVDARHVKGTWTMERTDSRTTNVGEIWISDDVPFGLAQWTVKNNRETKDGTDARTEFREATRVSVEMSAHETGEDAESELEVE